MIKYITIIDPNGGEYGAERTPVPVNHRVIYDKQFYGTESVRKLFRHQDEMLHFLSHLVAQPVGSTGKRGDLEWTVGDKP